MGISCQKTKYQAITESGGAGESHPHAPTDPYVTVSRHTAPASHKLKTSRSQAVAKRNPAPPSYLVDHHLLQAGSSPSLQPHYRAFNTDSPPAERVGSGCPPEGGDDFGKAPSGLIIHLLILTPIVLVHSFLALGCIYVWFLHPNQLC